MTRSWKYLPALDGIRAFAVAAVVVFHFWPSVLPGGFIGVDIFFVMSGFLITSMMNVEHERHDRIDLAAFWGRRIRRLVPAVLVLVTVCSVALWWTDTGSALYIAHAGGALTWTTNLVEAFFGRSPVFLHNTNTVLDHLWSLAIEEQFYLVWPIAGLLLVRKVASPSRRVMIVGVAIAASATSMAFAGPVVGYFRTDARAFELLAGAALAYSGVTQRPLDARWCGAAAAAGFIVLGAVSVLVEPQDAWLYPWGFLVITAAATLLVAAATNPPTWLVGVLERRAVRHVGQVSYGIYLWHIPVFRILSSGRTGIDSGWLLAAVRLAVLAAVVEASYRFVEQPFRTGRVRFGWGAAGVGYAIALASLLLMVPTAREDWNRRWDSPVEMPTAAQGQRRVLVTGDLSAIVLGDRLAGEPDDSDDDPGSALAVWTIADAGCSMASGPDDNREVLRGEESERASGYCRNWPTRWTHAAAAFHPDVAVVSAGFNDTSPMVDGDQRLSPEAAEAVYVEATRAGIASLRSGHAGIERVYLVTVEDWSALALAGGVWSPERVELQRRYNDALATVADSDPGVSVVTLPADDWSAFGDGAEGLGGRLWR